MITKYLIAMTVVPLLLISWVIVQRVTKIYSINHPELGPHREEGGGCGSSCSCSGSKKKACQNNGSNN
jgi:hypothetical protein